MKLTDLFYFRTGSLPALEYTDEGDIPLVYGTTENNGIEKFVSVEHENQIFKPPLITVSYLGTSFVQVVPFTTSIVDKSNIIILAPKNSMSLEEMYFHSFKINRIGKFGFHYGRRMNMRQLRKINLLPFKNFSKKVNFRKILPKIVRKKYPTLTKNFKLVSITDIFHVISARSKGFDQYDKGSVPFISNGMMKMGLVGFVEPHEKDKVIKADSISVTAFCDATIQNAPFLPRGNGGSGLVILTPKEKMSRQEMIFHAAYINRVFRWRFSYGRMVTKDRIKKLMIRTAN